MTFLLNQFDLLIKGLSSLPAPLAFLIIVAFPVATLFVCIFVHELAHTLAAWSLIGVSTTKLSIGMGPELFHFQLGKLTIVVNLIPMPGLTEYAPASPENPIKVHIATIMAVIAAGPLTNLLCAAVACWLYARAEDPVAIYLWLCMFAVNLGYGVEILPLGGDGSVLLEHSKTIYRYFTTR